MRTTKKTQKRSIHMRRLPFGVCRAVGQVCFTRPKLGLVDSSRDMGSEDTLKQAKRAYVIGVTGQIWFRLSAVSPLGGSPAKTPLLGIPVPDS